MSARRWRPDPHLDRLSGIYLWIAFIIIFGVASPHVFLTEATAQQIASAQAINGIIALALLVPLVSGQYDLSVGANANLTAIIAIVLQSERHWPVVPSIAVAILVGAAIGLINGFVVVKLRVSSFIATLGTGSIIAAGQEIVSSSQQPAPPISSGWLKLTQIQVGGFQIVVVYLVVLSFIAWWFLDHTPAGRYLYAIGGNVDAARLSGVRTSRWIWTSLIISGTVAGVAGVLFASLSGPSLGFGQTLLLPAFAAAFLGSTQLSPGRFNVWGTLLAIFVLATGATGLQLLSGAQWVSDLFNGLALIGAVALAVNRQSRVARRKEDADAARGDPAASADHDRLDLAVQTPGSQPDG